MPVLVIFAVKHLKTKLLNKTGLPVISMKEFFYERDLGI